MIDHYEAKLISANDYYPFGMMMPGRKFSASGSYRYGFNGKENDNEVKGEGNSIDFGARIYDPRLGRWMSTDPVTKAWLSPYQYASANPVNLTDPDGGDEIHFHYYTVSVTVPMTIIGDDGLPKVESRSMQQTYKWVEIIKNDQKDKFFVHRNTETSQNKPIEFYPTSGNGKKTGITYTSYFFFKVVDSDYESLQKLVQEFPSFKSEVTQTTMESAQAAKEKNAAKENRNWWGTFYQNLAYKAEKAALDAKVNGLMLGVLTGVIGEVLMARIASGGLWLGRSVNYGGDWATLKSLNNLNPKKGWFDVVVHGDVGAPGVLFSINSEVVGAQKLYELMLKSGYSPGTRIRLISCNAANGGRSSVAQELSNLSKAEVVAPTARVRVEAGGKIITEDGSKLQVFKPGN